MNVEVFSIILRPLIRFCLRRSLTIQDLMESAKVTFIEVASEEMRSLGTKVNVSRLSVMTGMHRRDVMRILKQDSKLDQSASIVTRVLGQWEQDPRFLSKSKQPRILSLEGDDSDFRRLVRLISTDINPGTVLFELERIGAIERVKGGLKLVKQSYVPKSNPKESFALLARDTEDLIAAVEENILGEEKIPNLHGRTEYDNIAKREIPRIRKWLIQEGSAFHQKVRTFLAQYDKDINPSLPGDGGAKVVFSAFSRSTVNKEIV